MADEVQNGQISAIADDFEAPAPVVSEFEEADPSADAPPPLPAKMVKTKAELPTKTEQEWEDPEEEDEQPEGKTAAKPVAESPKAPAYDPKILQRARDYGYEDEEIAEFTPKQLAAVVSKQDRQLADAYRQQRQTPAEKVEAKTEAKPDPFKLDIADEFLNDEKYDESVRKTFKSLKAVNEALIERLNKHDELLQQNNQRESKREFEATSKQIDDFFNDSDDAELYGEGRTRDLPENSVERFARIKVLNQMDKIRKGYIAAGETLPDHKELAAIAEQMVHGKVRSQATDDNAPKRGRDLTKVSRDEAGRILPNKPTPTVRPGNRNLPKAKGTQAALAGIAEALGGLGIRADATDSAVEESLL